MYSDLGVLNRTTQDLEEIENEEIRRQAEAERRAVEEQRRREEALRKAEEEEGFCDFHMSKDRDGHGKCASLLVVLTVACLP